MAAHERLGGACGTRDCGATHSGEVSPSDSGGLRFCNGEELLLGKERFGGRGGLASGQGEAQGWRLGAPSEGSGEALFRPLTKVCELVVLDIERLGGACAGLRRGFAERFPRG